MNTLARILTNTVLAVASCALAQSAAAQPPVYTQTAQPILPYRGMYYEPGHGGTGLTLDIDKKGYIFAVFYTYTEDGNPTYYLMEGRYIANSDKDRIRTGVLGSFEATPYVSAGGECLGTGCTYKSPTRTATNYAAQIEWTAPRTATLTIGTQTWHIRGGQYTISDADLIEGQWFFNGVWSIPGRQPTSPWGALTFKKNSTLTPASFAQLPFIADNSEVYDVTWKRIPLFTFDNFGDHYYALFNRDSGRLDIVQAYYTTGGTLNTNTVLPFAVAFIDGPDTIRGRHEFPIGGNPGTYINYSVFTDITLTRSWPVSTFLNQTDQ